MPNKRKRVERANWERWYEDKLAEIKRLKSMRQQYPTDHNGQPTLTEEKITLDTTAVLEYIKATRPK